MSEGLTRRGFVRAAGAGLVVLCAPSFAHASPPVVPRWALAPRALDVSLFVRAPGAAVELLAYAIEVSAELRTREQRHPVALVSRGLVGQRMARIALPRERRMVVPAETETLYDSFTGSWPAGVSGRATLALRTSVRADLGHLSEAERGTLASLSGLTVEFRVTRPA